MAENAREECTYLAKLAEQAERYDEMVEEMKKVSSSERGRTGEGREEGV